MNRAKKLLIGLCVAVMAVVSACAALAWPSTTITRYKVTVTVDTPEGPRSGSSVLEFHTQEHFKLLPEQRRFTESMRGEAVAVDLPGNQTLFALLKQDGTRSIGELIGLTLYPNGRNENTPARTVDDPPVPMNRYLIIGGKELNEPGIPMLVRFRDINDPKSVEKVYPTDLKAAFGNGVAIKAITVQVTDDSVTVGIEKRITWLRKVYQYLDSAFHPPGIPVGNFIGLFSTEVRREP